MSHGWGVVGPRTGRRDERRAKRREGGRIEEEHSTRGERVKSARRGRQTTGIASPDCWYCRCRRGRAHRFQGDRLSAAHGVHTLRCAVVSFPRARWMIGGAEGRRRRRCVETAGRRRRQSGNLLWTVNQWSHRSVGVSGRVVILSHDKIDLRVTDVTLP